MLVFTLIRIFISIRGLSTPLVFDWNFVSLRAYSNLYLYRVFQLFQKIHQPDFKHCLVLLDSMVILGVHVLLDSTVILGILVLLDLTVILGVIVFQDLMGIFQDIHFFQFSALFSLAIPKCTITCILPNSVIHPVQQLNL